MKIYKKIKNIKEQKNKQKDKKKKKQKEEKIYRGTYVSAWIHTHTSSHPLGTAGHSLSTDCSSDLGQLALFQSSKV